MGLAITLNGETVAQWSYSGFYSFRVRLAQAAGIDLTKMHGYYGFDVEKAKTAGWQEDAGKEKVQWDTITDPIAPFLAHSDCEGKLSPEVCATVGPRLRELMKDWPKTVTIHPTKEWTDQGYDKEMTFPDHDKAQGESLADAMEEAVKLNKPLEYH
jgi:hypothetical protein